MKRYRAVLPSDVLKEWDPNSNPYGDVFTPGLIFERIEAILHQITDIEEFARLARSGNGSHAAAAVDAVSKAAEISQLFRTHNALCRHWITDHKATDLIAPRWREDPRLSNVTEDVVSLALAGRTPLLLCSAIEAMEIESYSGYGPDTKISLPVSMLSLARFLLPLLKANRCVLWPSHETIETCMLEPDDVELRYELGNVGKCVEDAWASNEHDLLRMLPLSTEDVFAVNGVRPLLLGPGIGWATIVDEHQHNYTLYQNAVARLCDTIRSAKSESAIRYAFLEFESGIADLQVRYDRLQRNLRWKGIEVTVGLVATVLSLSVPGIAEQLRVIAGSATVWQV